MTARRSADTRGVRRDDRVYHAAVHFHSARHQVDFSLMGHNLTGSIVVVIIFMAVARPLTVFLCALPDRRARWSCNEMLFMCWTRETGVIPATLVSLLLAMKAPGAQLIASVTFLAILMTILILALEEGLLGRLGTLPRP
jgi:potassium/hydrogen antiporter